MAQKVTLNKIDFDNVQFQRVINSNFTQIIPTTSPPPTPSIVTLFDFFKAYSDLFYQIPKTGNNSHQTLIQKSSDYIGAQQSNDQIQALIAEITTLRLNNLEATQATIENISLKSQIESLKSQISASQMQTPSSKT